MCVCHVLLKDLLTYLLTQLGERCHETPHRPHHPHQRQIQVLGIGKTTIIFTVRKHGELRAIKWYLLFAMTASGHTGIKPCDWLTGVTACRPGMPAGQCPERRHCCFWIYVLRLLRKWLLLPMYRWVFVQCLTPSKKLKPYTSSFSLCGVKRKTRSGILGLPKKRNSRNPRNVDFVSFFRYTPLLLLFYFTIIRD